jgi:2-amino-4-hydroxy-6-hydroxymethyldihydropteridine diphosphokinase
MTRAIVALGSNLGDRVRYLRDAVDGLPGLVQLSRVYETEPVGGPDEQGPYLNLVARLENDLDARELLAVGQTLEEKASRERVVRWGPRTLDVDLLWLDGVVIDEPDLTVPHPRMFERAFVLAPLEEVAPDLVPEDWRERVDDHGVRVVGELAELAAES